MLEQHCRARADLKIRLVRTVRHPKLHSCHQIHHIHKRLNFRLSVCKTLLLMHTQFEDEHCETRCSGREPCLFFREGSAPSLQSNSVSSGWPQRAHKCRALLPCRSASRTTIPRLRWKWNQCEVNFAKYTQKWLILTESEQMISGAGSESGESYLAPGTRMSTETPKITNLVVYGFYDAQ
jgi:hypothetical protein